MRRRLLAGALGLLVATAGAVAPAGAASAAPRTADVTWSSDDGSHRLEVRPVLPLQAAPTRPSDAVVDVDASVARQPVLGQGGVLESSSVANITHLSAGKRSQLMHQLFDRVSGNGYDLVRLAMGCPDMCSEPFYSYDDVPTGQTDPGLTHFSIRRDLDAGIVALAKQARRINPDVRFYLSMWSAPAWMKTNASLVDGGTVRPEYYPVLARYQRRAVQAYEAHGIPVLALTPQNEPSVHPAYPSGAWTGEQMRDYVKVLGPELRAHGLRTQIWIGDDNPHSLVDFDPAVLDDPAAAAYAGGVAIHDYAGDDPAVLQDFRARYPDVPLHLTERSYYGVDGETTTAGTHQAGVRRLIDLYRNGITSWSYWITFLDTSGQPNTGPLDAACCSVPFSAPPGDLDAYTTNRDHYLYGQLTREVLPGATVVLSSQTSEDVSDVAFRNPDGTVVVVVANGAPSPRTVAVRSSDGTLTDTLPARTVATYRWHAGASDPAPAGTVRLVNRHDPTHVLQGTNEPYLDIVGSANTAMTPAGWDDAQQRWDLVPVGSGRYRLTNVRAPGQALQVTGEQYRGWTGVVNVAATPAQWDSPDQLWRLERAGGGWYRIVGDRTGLALQATQDRYAYGAFDDAYETVASPAFWDIPEQQWRLDPVR